MTEDAIRLAADLAEALRQSDAWAAALLGPQIGER